MDHDAAHKYIHSLPEVAADLLRLVIPEWVDELDLSTLEGRPSEFLDAAHRKRVGDMAWRVRFRGGQLQDGERPYVLVLVEFQSEADRRMAERMREYTELLLHLVSRSGAAEREGGMPWVLPIVVYNGSEPWTAAGQASDLAPLPSPAAARDLALLQPQAHRLLAAGGALTSRSDQAEDWPLRNRVAATVRLQRSGASGKLLPRLLEEAARFPGAANGAFRRALHAWARALWEHKTGGDPGFPAFDEIEQKEGAAMPTLFEANWDRWEAGVRAEGKEEGREEGIAQGLMAARARLGRQAALKFGVKTGERLAGLLEGFAAREDLDQIGDWVIECGAGEELLSRVSTMRENAGNGQ